MQSNIENDSVRQWLHARKITDAAIERFSLVWSADRVTIPIRDAPGRFLFNKYRHLTGDVKYRYDKGGMASLFGADTVGDAKRVVICEGELDTVALWGAGIVAVSSTGGCGTWRKEWSDLLADKEVIICYDNDDAGMKGAVNTLSFTPWAKVVFVPPEAGVKDVTDYLVRGGNMEGLLATAQHFVDVSVVDTDALRRAALWQNTVFHEEWKKRFVPVVAPTPSRTVAHSVGDERARAKEYPIENIISFGQRGKAKCLWHSEKTASLAWNKKNNTAHCFGACARTFDSIDAYMKVWDVDFKEAIKKLS